MITPGINHQEYQQKMGLFYTTAACHISTLYLPPSVYFFLNEFFTSKHDTLPNAGPMLGRRLRHRLNIGLALGQ